MFLSHARMLAFAQKFALFKISFHAKVMAYMQVVRQLLIIVLITSGCILQKGAARWNPSQSSFCITAYFRPKCGVEFNLTKISTINLQGQRCTKVSRKSAYFSLANSIFLNTIFFSFNGNASTLRELLAEIYTFKKLFNPKRDFVFRKSESWADVSSTWRWFYLSKTSMKKDPCPIVSVVAYRGKSVQPGLCKTHLPQLFQKTCCFYGSYCSQERFSLKGVPLCVMS